MQILCSGGVEENCAGVAAAGGREAILAWCYIRRCVGEVLEEELM